jgi:HD-GYP domain-containing protein (c-di-GMP phosphodiesterase class II)
MYLSVPLADLPLGVKLAGSIYDDRQTKLLAGGTEITEQLLEVLDRRNISSVVIAAKEFARVMAYKPQGTARTALPARAHQRITPEAEVCRELDHLTALPRHPKQIPTSISPFSLCVSPRPKSSYDRDHLNFLAERNEAQVGQVNEFFETSLQGDSSGVGVVHEMAADSLAAAMQDLDAFACLGANPFTKPYPMRHAVHLATTAVAIGTALGLDEADLIELGIGCLIHDLGMLRVDQMMVSSRSVLDSEAFGNIRLHPFRTLELLEKNLELIPVGARLVAYQIHERADGSGYPRGRTLEQTHPLARIAAVADVYTALVTPRPYRPGLLPYFAMEKLLKDVADGLFDSQAVRGLLKAIGLFPIGSYVLIKEGIVGRVIRPNAADFTRPLLEVWKAGKTRTAPAIVDLSEEPRLSIARPLTSLDR